MKRALLFLGLIAVLVSGMLPAVAQERDPFGGYPTGCDEGTLEAIEAADPAVDYSALCDAFLACVVEGRPPYNCQLEAAAPLIAACDSEDVRCRNMIMLHAAAQMISVPKVSEGRAYCYDPGFDQLPEIIRLAAAGDYERAGEIVAAIPETMRCHPMVPFVNGLLRELSGDLESARGWYISASDALVNYLALPTLSSLWVLAQLAEPAEVAYEIEQFRRWVAYDVPAALPVLDNLSEAYPLDTLDWQPMLAYPVASSVDTFDPYSLRDLTLEQPLSYATAYLYRPATNDAWEPRQLVVDIYGMVGDRQPNSLIRTNQVIEANPTQFPVSSSLIDIPDRPIVDIGAGFGLISTPSGGVLVTTTTRLESGEPVYTTWLSAAPGEPDPRRALTGMRRCEGGVLSPLHVGEWVESGTESNLRFNTDPDPEAAYIEVSTAQLVGEPTCIGTDAWWPARIVGQTGWVRENEGNLYVAVALLSDTEAPFLHCPTALPSRLFAGARARVLIPVELMRAPYDNLLAPDLTPGEVVTVDSERVCSDDDLWWAVTMEDGRRGYLPESDADTYFLEPVPFTP
jgi:hypothetical protein